VTTVQIGGQPATCNHVADFNITCSTPVGVVGFKNITLSIANRTAPTFVEVQRELLSYVCDYGYYGLVGELCSPCPVG
jgi:hypothetical protein